MSDAPNPYDAFAYSNFSYQNTHPGHLATMARFYGMQAVPVSRCRVLELGCGAGGNLIPIAYQYPDSEFIGVDLSARAIERGCAAIKAIGLRNITLREADIAGIGPEYGHFDYVIAHGVYSWVPPAVREKVLAICRDNLSPQGVVFLSFNARPYGHMRSIVRDAMLFHVRHIKDAQKSIEEARAGLKTIVEGTDATTVYGQVIRDQLARISRFSDIALFHDDLEEVASFLLQDVATEAERHGLQYLCDASLWRRWYQNLPEGGKAFQDHAASAAYFMRDQYLDFTDCHPFRQSLWCRAEVAVAHNVQPSIVREFHLASSLAPAASGDVAMTDGSVEFTDHRGDSLRVGHKLTQAALTYLGQQWPAAVRFADLVERARELGSDRADDVDFEEHVTVMIGALFKLACGGPVELHAFPSPYVTSLSERPEASLVARRQAEQGTLVTSLLHNMVKLESEIQRQLLGLVDGTRNTDQIVDDLRHIAVEKQLVENAEAVTREDVERGLGMLGRMALLVS